jgi:hypothetical protein
MIESFLKSGFETLAMGALKVDSAADSAEAIPSFPSRGQQDHGTAVECQSVFFKKRVPRRVHRKLLLSSDALFLVKRGT